ncbi:MAG: pyruvate kinase [Deltaproteobacteria bacterium]|nr:MAG: pyruvate kinase [Deltaproteobacteria bacterium]
MRKTKIIATLGPASATPEVFRELLIAGVDVVRLNFSHGSHAEHRETIGMVRAVATELGHPVAILLDLSGPKIRVGRLPAPLQLTSGAHVVVTTTTDATVSMTWPDLALIPCTYEDLPHDLSPGDPILLDDGLLELRVVEIRPPELRCRVVHGGTLRSNKGINLPGVPLSTPSFTEKDRRDLHFGLEMAVDYVALSFVRSAADVAAVKLEIEKGGGGMPVIAKIEKKEALEDLGAILEVADGIMVARGDLGVEVPTQYVPLLQKSIIAETNRAGKLVITATQMLESMTQNARPTRAEVSDVANAILDGTDAVMLSAETAVGSHPVETVRMMGKIADVVEKSPYYPHNRNADDPFVRAAVTIAHAPAYRAIVLFTLSGHTPRNLAKARPEKPIIALTPEPAVYRRLSLVWGVRPILMPFADNTEELLRDGKEILRETGLFDAGDQIILAAGTTKLTGVTNMVKIDTIP